MSTTNRPANPTLTQDQISRAQVKFAPVAFERLSKDHMLLAQKALIAPIFENSDCDAQVTGFHDQAFAHMQSGSVKDYFSEIERADQDRSEIDDGTPVARLLCEGAIQNMSANAANGDIQAAEEMVRDFSIGLEPLVANPYVRIVLSICHRLLGSFHRGAGYFQELSDAQLQPFLSHFAKARELLDGLDPVALNSPLAAQARFALLDAQDDAADVMMNWYHDWVDLAPSDRESHRKLALYNTPVWFGSDFTRFEGSAKTASRRHIDTTGFVPYFDMMNFPSNCYPDWMIDMDLACYLAGAQDLVRMRPNQSMANEAANSLAVLAFGARQSGGPINQRSAVAAAALDDMFRNHVQEIQLSKWNNRSILLASIALCFEEELSRGQSIGVGPHGLTARVN